MKRRIALAALAAFALTLAGGAAHAAFPERTVRIIVPFPPGGSTDVVARRVAAKAQTILGQSVVVENIGGAGGLVGSDAASKAAPDGYTLLLAQPSLASNVSLREKMPFDIERDFASVVYLGGHPGLLVGSTATGYKTFADFMKHVKANPGKATYSTAGVGTFPHLTMEMLRADAKVDFVHIPYKGAGPAMVDLLGGRVDVKIDAYATAIAHLKAGKLVPLAVSGLKRIPQMPDVPTIAESGYPGFDSSIWMGLMVPAKTPADVVSKLEKAFLEAARDPEVVRSLNDDGVYMDAKAGKELDALVKTEIVKWRRVVKESGIKAE
jgi:tripartite-type tricarboxylate transporter receptor subunit TctC